MYKLIILLLLSGCTPEPPAIPPVKKDVPKGNSQLHWDAPTTREDGTPLSLGEIEGYRVYSSSSVDGLYTVVIDIEDTRYTVDNALGYVYITTYSVEGDESKPSNIVFIGD